MNNALENCKNEDYVEYFLYPATNYEEGLREKLKVFVAPLVENYIWNKDEFTFNASTDNMPENEAIILKGITFYGENIDDEWFIVYVLRKISESFDVLIRVCDVDGEFLLIEAASHLPKWIKPENSEQQVFIYKGKVRILPSTINLSSTSTDNIMKHFEEKPISDTETIVSNAIERRIEKFSNLQNLLHKRVVMLPAKVAALIDIKPKIIASAVTSYCHHDIIDKRIYRKMEHFPPEDMVLRSVTFTKFLYAMLTHDKTNPERSKWQIPHPSAATYQDHLLGYKITCGLEILASRSNKKSQTDLKLNKKWNQFLESLKKKGYFKDLLEHSKEHVELEKAARSFFLSDVGCEESHDTNLLDILQILHYDVDKMREEECALPQSDDEKWMQVSEEEFNKLLKDRFGFEDMNVINTPASLSSIINKFLNQTSDIDGIENSKRVYDESDNVMDIVDEKCCLSFNPEEFVTSVEKLLDDMELENDMFDENESEDSDSDECDSDNDTLVPKDPLTRTYMDLMDNELKNTTLATSFVTKDNKVGNKVDLDQNMFENLFRSYKEEFGGSGPAGNLLHSMGLKLGTEENQ